MKQNAPDMDRLTRQIKQWGSELGFQQVGISNTDLQEAESHLHSWLEKNYHGNMSYMQQHGLKRSRPALLHPDTRSIIS